MPAVQLIPCCVERGRQIGLEQIPDGLWAHSVVFADFVPNDLRLSFPIESYVVWALRCPWPVVENDGGSMELDKVFSFVRTHRDNVIVWSGANEALLALNFGRCQAIGADRYACLRATDYGAVHAPMIADALEPAQIVCLLLLVGLKNDAKVFSWTLKIRPRVEFAAVRLAWFFV